MGVGVLLSIRRSAERASTADPAIPPCAVPYVAAGYTCVAAVVYLSTSSGSYGNLFASRSVEQRSREGKPATLVQQANRSLSKGDYKGGYHTGLVTMKTLSSSTVSYIARDRSISTRRRATVAPCLRKRPVSRRLRRRFDDNAAAIAGANLRVCEKLHHRPGSRWRRPWLRCWRCRRRRQRSALRHDILRFIGGLHHLSHLAVVGRLRLRQCRRLAVERRAPPPARQAFRAATGRSPSGRSGPRRWSRRTGW